MSGATADAFMYLGLYNAETENKYPYRSGYDGYVPPCAYDASSATAVSVSSYSYVAPKSVPVMKGFLSTQPLAVSVDSDSPDFKSYASGIFDSSTCGTQLNHNVLVVGWGTDAASGLDYWLVKNSWSSNWGDQGYIKIQIVDGVGICGVQLEPMSVVAN